MSSQKCQLCNWTIGGIITGKMVETAFLFLMDAIIAMINIILILVTVPVTVMKLVMQVGILTDIFSPEGVHTNFTYEANRYGKRFSGDANYAKREYLAGGLRVQRIREDDLHSGFSRRRLFFYALSKPEEWDRNYKDGLGVPKHALTERDYCTQMERLTIIPTSGNTKLCRLWTWGQNPVSNITF